MSETKDGPESQEFQRLHTSEMPKINFGEWGEVKEDVQELFRSKLRMFESMSQDIAAGNAKLKSDVSVFLLD